MSLSSSVANNARLVSEIFASFGSAEKDADAFKHMCSEDFLWENSDLPPIEGVEAACKLVDQSAAALDFSSLEIKMFAPGRRDDTMLCKRVNSFYDARKELLFSLSIMGR